MIEMVGEGELVISFESKGNRTSISPEDRLQLYWEILCWSDEHQTSSKLHLLRVTLLG